MGTFFCIFAPMKTLRLILALALMLLPLGAAAQSKAETSLYNKTIRKSTVKAAEKFLKKYPGSIYAQKVLQLKDSLLMADFLQENVSEISGDDARAMAGNALDAVGWKKDGVEHVIALDADLSLRILSAEGELEQTRILPRYTMEESPGELTLAIPLELVPALGGRRNYLHFAYRNGKSEYVEILYMPEEDIQHQVLFYGNPLKDGAIEGDSPEMMEGLQNSAEVCYLVNRLKENPSLIRIAKADMLTDASIRWWLEKNPKAQTTASRLSFGLLDPESSIVAACKKARKEKGGKYSAAMFDIRGYTVICSIKGGEYVLVWCEPVCRNKKTDKYIRTIYFEKDGTTLDLFYYKGKTTFKKKISLPSQALKHL